MYFLKIMYSMLPPLLPPQGVTDTVPQLTDLSRMWLFANHFLAAQFKMKTSAQPRLPAVYKRQKNPATRTD